MSRVELLTAQEAADQLRVSLVTLLRRTRRGEIPHRKLSARQLVFVKQEIDDFIRLKAAGRRLDEVR